MTREVDFRKEAVSSRQYMVRIRTRSGEFEGILFSPDSTRRLAEAIVHMEEFVNLKDAKDLSSKEKFPFMVISKDHIETIKVLDER